MSTLIIVESPAKAKSIQGYLGPGYIVRASFGHVTDLPLKELGVDLDTLEETYVPREAKSGFKSPLPDLRKYAGQASRVLIASDPDREGEAIAWHLARELKLRMSDATRVEFREVTPDAVRRAVANPRTIDMGRVDAQRARRVIDRVLGFQVSEHVCQPAGARSAGRVQSPALHLICVREKEILSFVPENYWTLHASYEEGFSAFVPAPADGSTAASDAGGEEAGVGSETSGERGRIVPKRFQSEEDANETLAQARQHKHVVRDVDERRAEKRPELPYTTSTLQQDGSRKLRLSVKQTADLAQTLFEAGYITYHRTDSTRVSDEAVEMARAFIAGDRPDVLPDRPPTQRTKAGAQDAHEAIRPTRLTGDDSPPAGTEQLYRMIRARFLASQSKPAVYNRTTIWIDSGPVEWVAQGSVLLEPGYLHYWRPYARQEDEILPAVTAARSLAPSELKAEARQTKPPSRYSEADLVKKLEASGIGRPSTYPTIIDTLFRRAYVQRLKGGRGKELMQPTELGIKLDALLAETFPDVIVEEYTAAMETALDRIEGADGLTRPGYLREWYGAFASALDEARPRVRAYCEEHGLKPAFSNGAGGEETNKKCDRCGEANYRKLSRKTGRGSFLKCPSCSMMRNLTAKVKPGACGKCGSALIERSGRDKKTFFGCVRYGAETNPCDFIEGRGAAGNSRFERQETDKTCPKCAKQKLVILTPREGEDKTPFYICSDRECRFSLTVGMRRRRTPCPMCSGVVLERARKPAQGAPKDSAGTYWACCRCSYKTDLIEEAAQGESAASAKAG